MFNVNFLSSSSSRHPPDHFDGEFFLLLVINFNKKCFLVDALVCASTRKYHRSELNGWKSEAFVQLLQLVTFIECELGMAWWKKNVAAFFGAISQHGAGRVFLASARCAPNEVGNGNKGGERKRETFARVREFAMKWDTWLGFGSDVALRLQNFLAQNTVRTDCASLCLIVRKDSIKVNVERGARREHSWTVWRECCVSISKFWHYHVPHAREGCPWCSS